MGVGAKFDAGGVSLEDVYARLERIHMDWKPTRGALILIGLYRDQAEAEAGEVPRQTVAVHAALPAEIEEGLVAWAYEQIKASAPLESIVTVDDPAEHEARRLAAITEEESRLKRLAEMADGEAQARAAKLAESEGK